jgi:hypothetical protein
LRKGGRASGSALPGSSLVTSKFYSVDAKKKGQLASPLIYLTNYKITLSQQSFVPKPPANSPRLAAQLARTSANIPTNLLLQLRLPSGRTNPLHLHNLPVDVSREIAIFIEEISQAASHSSADIPADFS